MTSGSVNASERTSEGESEPDSPCPAETAATFAECHSLVKGGFFPDVAPQILTACRHLSGATWAYVWIPASPPRQREDIFVVSGRNTLSVREMTDLLERLSGLRRQSSTRGKPTYQNGFPGAGSGRTDAPAVSLLDNALLAILSDEIGRTGELGLLNKPGGFGDRDACCAAAFARMIAVDLHSGEQAELLEASQQRLSAVMQAANDAIVCADQVGRVFLWNRAAERMFGYPAEEIVGQTLDRIIPPRLRVAHSQAMQRLRDTGQSTRLGSTTEVVGMRRDGGEFPLELSLAVGRTAEGAFFTGIIRDITQRKDAERALQETLAELELRVDLRTAQLAAINDELRHEIAERQRLEREILDLSTAEQQRIGRELHDGLGQELTGLGYLARSLQQKLAKKGLDEAAMAAELARGIPRVLAQVRDVSRALVSWEVNGAEFVSALYALVAAIEEQTDIICHCEIAEASPVPDDRVAVQLYRIAQESLNNAVKHAQAQRIALSWRAEPETLVLEILDDGVGLDLSSARTAGSGLRIMEYRVRTLGGVLDIRSQPYGGTALTCRVPMRPGP